MHAAGIVIEAVRRQLSLQVKRISKEDAVEILAAQSADESFHKRMRHRNMGNGLDLVNFKYPQIRQPAVKATQRIVIGADVFR